MCIPNSHLSLDEPPALRATLCHLSPVPSSSLHPSMEHTGTDSDLKSLSLKASVRAGFPWLFSWAPDTHLGLPKALRADAKAAGLSLAYKGHLVRQGQQGGGAANRSHVKVPIGSQ